MKPTVGILSDGQLEEILRQVVRFDIEPQFLAFASEGLSFSCDVRLCGASDLAVQTIEVSTLGGEDMVGSVRVGLFGAISPVRYRYEVLLMPHPEYGFSGFSGQGRLLEEGPKKVSPRGAIVVSYNKNEFSQRFAL